MTSGRTPICEICRIREGFDHVHKVQFADGVHEVCDECLKPIVESQQGATHERLRSESRWRTSLGAALVLPPLAVLTMVISADATRVAHVSMASHFWLATTALTATPWGRFILCEAVGGLRSRHALQLLAPIARRTEEGHIHREPS
jgi:hypothetical protein